MQTKNRERERGRDGRFVSIKNGIEDTLEIAYLLLKLLPFLLLIIFIFNYYGLWKIVKKFIEMIMNIGNPDCEIKCIAPNPIDEPD